MGLSGTPGDHLEPVTHDHVLVGSWMSPWLNQPSEQPVPVSWSTSSSSPMGLRGSGPCHLAAVGHLVWEHPPPPRPGRRGDIVAVVDRPLTGVPSGYQHPKSSSRSQRHPRALSAAGRRDLALDPMGSMGDKGVSAPPTLAGGCSPPKSRGMVPIAFPHKTTFTWEEPPLSSTGSTSIPAAPAPDQPPRSRQPGWARWGRRVSPPSVGRTQLLLQGEEEWRSMPCTRQGHLSGG